MNETWLPLTDYSTKYKVSISTLRRRIKCDKISFSFEDGKYFILDTPLEQHDQSPGQIQGELESIDMGAGHMPRPAVDFLNHVGTEVIAHPEKLAETVNHLMEELKKAYRLILHEKEEQILQLREEITDLRTLTRVLESENDRLNVLIKKESASEDAPAPLF